MEILQNSYKLMEVLAELGLFRQSQYRVRYNVSEKVIKVAFASN